MAHEPDLITKEFTRERHIRRTAKVLATKRDTIHKDIQQLIAHLGLLLPCQSTASYGDDSHGDLLQSALDRLGDETFSQFILQILQEISK
jgi:hypothetical protein